MLEQALHIVEGPLTTTDALESLALDADVLGKWPQAFRRPAPDDRSGAPLVLPELVIADEPTSMLDASMRATILNLLLDLRGRLRMGIIFITHDIARRATAAIASW